MNRTKIEWLRSPNGDSGYTWNPIKGLCPVGCRYCYAKKMYKRFGLLSGFRGRAGYGDSWLEEKELEVWGSGSATSPRGPRKSSRVFVCSTFELFHPVANKWRDQIFKIIEVHPRHTFIILTKLPELIDRPMPDNVWLGVSCERHWEHERAYDLIQDDIKAKHKFISIEPMLDLWADFSILKYFQWIIVGRLTGHGRKHDPELAWIEDIVSEARKAKVPVFLKDNLSGIWPGKLIQEWPKEQHHEK